MLINEALTNNKINEIVEDHIELIVDEVMHEWMSKHIAPNEAIQAAANELKEALSVGIIVKTISEIEARLIAPKSHKGQLKTQSGKKNMTWTGF